MRNPVKVIYTASKEVLHRKSYLFLFLSLSLLMFAVFVIIPVFLIPGNSVLFQISIFTFKDYIVLIPLSFLISLMLSMQIYSFKKRKSAREIGGGVFGSYSGVIAGVFGTASCSSCVAALFGFLGLGTVFFLIKYQWYVVAASSFLVLLSLYITSVSIEKKCGVCK